MVGNDNQRGNGMGNDGTINYKLTILNFAVSVLIAIACFKISISYFTGEYVPVISGVACLVIVKWVTGLNNKIFAVIYN